MYLYISLGSSVMLFSPQDERKLHMLENSLNFRFKRIGTPGAKEIAEASADVATRKLESVSPYLARQFVPYARTFIERYVKQNSGEDRDSDFDEDESEEGSTNEDMSISTPVDEDLLDVNGNKVYSAVQVEDLLSRCLAAISNRGSISSRYIIYYYVL
jgi:hypothetical protein